MSRMENLKLYENFKEERSESINEAKAQKNLMHKLLGIPEDKKISEVYKSGKKLAKDLVDAIKKEKLVPEKDILKKATSMLVFAGNWPSDKENSIFDIAARSAKDYV